MPLAHQWGGTSHTSLLSTLCAPVPQSWKSLWTPSCPPPAPSRDSWSRAMSTQGLNTCTGGDSINSLGNLLQCLVTHCHQDCIPDHLYLLGPLVCFLVMAQFCRELCVHPCRLLLPLFFRLLAWTVLEFGEGYP